MTQFEAHMATYLYATITMYLGMGLTKVEMCTQLLAYATLTVLMIHHNC